MNINKSFKQYVVELQSKGLASLRALHQVLKNGGYADPVQGKKTQQEVNKLWIDHEKLFNSQA